MKAHHIGPELPNSTHVPVQARDLPTADTRVAFEGDGKNMHRQVTLSGALWDRMTVHELYNTPECQGLAGVAAVLSSQKQASG